MHNASLVHVVESKKDLSNDSCRLSLRKPFDFQDVIVKLAAAHDLAHNIEVDVILE